LRVGSVSRSRFAPAVPDFFNNVVGGASCPAVGVAVIGDALLFQ
jgi:hypothetical protein